MVETHHLQRRCSHLRAEAFAAKSDEIAKPSLWHRVLIWEKAVVGIQPYLVP
jgi:hypothetical protein